MAHRCRGTSVSQVTCFLCDKLNMLGGIDQGISWPGDLPMGLEPAPGGRNLNSCLCRHFNRSILVGRNLRCVRPQSWLLCDCYFLLCIWAPERTCPQLQGNDPTWIEACNIDHHNVRQGCLHACIGDELPSLQHPCAGLLNHS